MANIFKEMVNIVVPRNRFDLSHDHKFTCDMGELIPFMTVPTLPGDIFTWNVEILTRALALLSPVMHNVEICVDFTYTPFRIMWSEWEDWIIGKSAAAVPHIAIGSGMVAGEIGDYLGFPTAPTSAYNVLAFSMGAYVWSWDYYYRDQNLQTEKYSALVAGANTWANSLVSQEPLKVAWAHDYFTSNLPTAQADTTVELPLVTTEVDIGYEAGEVLLRDSGTGLVVPSSGTLTSDPSGELVEGATNQVFFDPNGTLTAAVQDAAVDIITVRRAFKLQEWLEKNIRGGRRYIEHMLSHWGVQTMTRVDIPVFLGQSKFNMVFSEVVSTAETLNSSNNETAVIGQLGGHGISARGTRQFKYHCLEHGVIMGMFYARPRGAYSQGIPRWLSYTDELDFPWPTFAHIGEQATLNKEIYVNHTTPDGTFGYLPRYTEWKYHTSTVSGEFGAGESLEYWHLGRNFSSDPNLNSTFIECSDTGLKRIFVDQVQDSLVVHAIMNIKVDRKLPKFGIPKL